MPPTPRTLSTAERDGSKRPMIAIVGRPNVGKSALFNRLAGRNIAIVHDRPGVTRDRLVSQCRRGPVHFDVMDTGGIGEAIADDFNVQVQNEARIAIEVADVILFVVDGLTGPTPIDQSLAATFRKSTKPMILVVNKVDTNKHGHAAAEFARFGFKHTIDVSAAHGLGIVPLVEAITALLPPPPPTAEIVEEAEPEVDAAEEDEELDATDEHDEFDVSDDADEDAEPRPKRTAGVLKLAIVGRPNAGKSSLINAIIGEQRTIVSNIAGTTRDAIDIPCQIEGRDYVLIDTAGLRRKARIHDTVEAFSAQQATRSIKRADLCVLMLDCTDIAMQDRKIAQLIVEYQKPCIIVLNKFDLYHPSAKMGVRKSELFEVARSEFFFMPYAPMIAVSAKNRQFLDEIFHKVKDVHEGSLNQPGTGQLNRLLQRAIARATEPLGTSGRAFKLLYASIAKDSDDHAEIKSPHFILFGNRAEHLQPSYLRYIESRIREEWPAEGIPFRFTIKGKPKREEGDSKGGPKTKTKTKPDAALGRSQQKAKRLKNRARHRPSA